jgi:hypothetical protein
MNTPAEKEASCGPRLCNGKLEVLIADESSYRCTVCDWSGWPQTDVQPGSGVILAFHPHLYCYYPHLHR